MGNEQEPLEKKGKPSERDIHDKFLMQSEDGKWWSDLACTDQDHAPEHYEQQGWDRVEDQQVTSKKYPKVKRRVHLQIEDNSGNEPIGCSVYTG